MYVLPINYGYSLIISGQNFCYATFNFVATGWLYKNGKYTAAHFLSSAADKSNIRQIHFHSRSLQNCCNLKAKD